ncbi:MAG: hypothetical protein OXI62_14775 [Chloroflexota bacterium]|nr:hypothetical protein [Chloroflexota bacterium]MCY3581378.1 hypothetical protein [Chloroflexota bacterium]MDE2651968.1 hypothetical protein [Chloroflexota bacterium]
MSRRYSLETKIDALNQIDQHDGDAALVSDVLEIPLATLRGWLAKESDLRRAYNLRRQGQFERLKRDLQSDMLLRGKAILSELDAQRLAKAPLNQLAAALGSLVTQALKLEEATQARAEDDERVIRVEYYYDGQVQDAPPWSGASDGQPRAVQSGGLRTPLGQDRAGQNGAAADGAATPAARMVAGTYHIDGQPGLARPKK